MRGLDVGAGDEIPRPTYCAQCKQYSTIRAALTVRTGQCGARTSAEVKAESP
jgi:hypothetical protein